MADIVDQINKCFLCCYFRAYDMAFVYQCFFCRFVKCSVDNETAFHNVQSADSSFVQLCSQCRSNNIPQSLDRDMRCSVEALIIITLRCSDDRLRH